MEKNCVVILDVKNAHNIKTNKEFKKTESVYEELEDEVYGELLFSGYTVCEDETILETGGSDGCTTTFKFSSSLPTTQPLLCQINL